MLPPEVQARVEQSAAAAPPLTPAQQQLIRRIFTTPAAQAPAA